jgi:hypothetical protein
MKPLTDGTAKVIFLMMLLLSSITAAFAQNQLPTAPLKRASDTTRTIPSASTKSPWEEVWSNMRTSFALPMEDIGKKPGIFVGSINAWVPLRAVFPLAVPFDPANPSTQGPPPNNLLAFASATYFPLGYWFLNFSYFQFIGRKEVLPWHPDFTYSFGYNDWHMYTFSLIYGNYGGNRFAPDVSKGEQVTRFDQGTWSLGIGVSPDEQCATFIEPERHSKLLQRQHKPLRTVADISFAPNALQHLRLLFWLTHILLLPQPRAATAVES